VVGTSRYQKFLKFALNNQTKKSEDRRVIEGTVSSSNYLIETKNRGLRLEISLEQYKTLAAQIYEKKVKGKSGHT